FDPDRAYRRRFVAELSRSPGHDALSYFAAVPRSWRLEATRPYPAPMVDLAFGRDRALQAYRARATVG
ncbi:MAG: hypothetical protein RIR62_3043, partial [Pseudomonadota bacterium]